MQADLLAPALATLDLAAFMREALYEAEQAGLAGELPIGAVVVIDGQIISRGRVRHKEQRNQLRHAELNALLAGGEPLWEHHDRAQRRALPHVSRGDRDGRCATHYLCRP